MKSQTADNDDELAVEFIKDDAVVYIIKDVIQQRSM